MCSIENFSHAIEFGDLMLSKWCDNENLKLTLKLDLNNIKKFSDWINRNNMCKYSIKNTISEYSIMCVMVWW